MFASAILRTSRTTYRGATGSGNVGTRKSPASRSTLLPSVLAGLTFKRSQRGLFDSVLPQSGHNLPKSRQKTARTWRPNVQSRKLYSETLQKFVKPKVTTRALRTIRKYGGLDAYIAQRDSSILGEYGRKLRSRMAFASLQKEEDAVAASVVDRLTAGAEQRALSTPASQSTTAGARPSSSAPSSLY